MSFKHPWILLFIPVVIFFAHFLKNRDLSSSIRFSSRELVKESRPTFRLALAQNLIYLRTAIIVLFLLALARPRMPLEEVRIQTEGIEIVLAIDCSGSMRAEDFQIAGQRKNRLEVAKMVVGDFIKMRKTDRIGMIAFAARAYTVCPLTLDYDWLLKNLARVEIGSIEDGTAIGSAISSSLNRVKNTEAKSKIVVLLTDGINNTGQVAPLTAAEAARALGIKIYAIGVGTKGYAPYPVQDPWGRTFYQQLKTEIDEEMLEKIAATTNGKYFRATDTESLREIYRGIDVLEKTPVEETGFRKYRELFSLFLIPGLILLILEITLSNTILRKLP